MKILIAVKSYQDMWRRGAHEKIRESWGRFCPTDVKFFLGGTPVHPLKDDEIRLDVRDDYNSLCYKTNAILQWALDRQYDYMVLVDTDTFINPIELDKLPWGEFDYAGLLLSWGPFMFGGCGFALSRDAARIILNNEVQDKMDDVSIGMILFNRPQPDVRILPCAWDRRIGWHFPKKTYSTSNYDPQFPWMDLMAQAHLGFPKRQHKQAVWIGGAVRETVIELSRMDRESI